MMGYSQLKRHQRVVVHFIAGLASFYVFMLLLYSAFPEVWTLSFIEWQLLVWSAITSVFAVYYAIRAYYQWAKLGITFGSIEQGSIKPAMTIPGEPSAVIVVGKKKE